MFVVSSLIGFRSFGEGQRLREFALLPGEAPASASGRRIPLFKAGLDGTSGVSVAGVLGLFQAFARVGGQTGQACRSAWVPQGTIELIGSPSGSGAGVGF